jgi:hypothetical protein
VRGPPTAEELRLDNYRRRQAQRREKNAPHGGGRGGATHSASSSSLAVAASEVSMPAGHDLARGASRGAGAYSPHRFEAPARGRSSSPAASDVPVSGTAAEIMNYLREVRRGSPQPTRGSSSPLGSGGTPRTSTSTSTGRRGGGGGSGKSGSTLEKNTTTHASHGHAGAASGSCGGDDRALRRRSVALETEAHEQTRAVAALRDALKAERTRHAEALAALETNHATTVREIKAAHSVATDRQLSFADQLLRDKAELAARCDTLAAEVEQLRGDNTTMQAGACFLFEKKKTDVFFFFNFIKIHSHLFTESIWHPAAAADLEGQLNAQRTAILAAERQKREAWVKRKTTEIRESTARALEPEVQRLLTLSRSETDRLAAQHAAQLSVLASERDAAERKAVNTALEEQSRAHAEQLDRLRTELAAARYVYLYLTNVPFCLLFSNFTYFLLPFFTGPIFFFFLFYCLFVFFRWEQTAVARPRRSMRRPCGRRRSGPNNFGASGIAAPRSCLLSAHGTPRMSPRFAANTPPRSPKCGSDAAISKTMSSRS